MAMRAPLGEERGVGSGDGRERNRYIAENITEVVSSVYIFFRVRGGRNRVYGSSKF